MNTEEFAAKFVRFFQAKEFQFHHPDLEPASVERASPFVRSLWSVGASVAGLNSGHEGPRSSNDDLKRCLDEFAKLGDLVAIYLKYGQPGVLVLLCADMLNDEQLLGRFQRIYEATANMKDFSFRIGWGKMPARSLVFTLFTSHDRAMHFQSEIAGKCKRFSLFNKTWVLPWTIDLEKMKISKYAGLPVTEFGESKLEAAFFDKSGA